MLSQLLARHLHEDRLGDTLRKLREHVGLAPAKHHGPQCLPDSIQILVAHDAAGVIEDLVLMAQSPQGAEPLAVDVLHDRDQLLQAVLERRSGQHQCMRTLDALERPRRNGVPILDPLGLVRDHDVGTPGLNELEVPGECLVVGDLAESRLRVASHPRGATSIDDQRLPLREARNLPLPLVLERGGTHHEYLLGAEMPREQLHGCERLDGLAESHLIGDETAPRASGEQGTLGLVRIQRRLQQPLQSGTLRTLRVRRLERAAAMSRVAGLGDEIQHIVIAPDLVAALAGVLEEFIELQVLAARKHITGSGAEEQPGSSPQGLRARRAGAEADLPLAAVAQIDLAVAGPRASAQRPHSSRTTLESRQNEFDVLAGTEIIGGEVRASAEVVSGLPTANGDAIPATALGVGDAVFREDRLVAEILDLESLLAAELPSQLP